MAIRWKLLILLLLVAEWFIYHRGTLAQLRQSILMRGKQST